MKLAVPLGELAGRGALPARRPLRVIDLGAGCGAMSLGLIASLGASPGESRDASPGAAGSVVAEGAAAAAVEKLELLAIDRDAPALAIAAAAVRDFAARRGVSASLTTRTADAITAPLPEADLIVMGTLLNELPADRALGVVERALRAVGEDGAVIVLEPALRETSRALHELRDAVIARGTGHVFAPCTRRCAPCPALADPDDWCHEDRALALPPRTAELARLTHLRDSGMKFAYLVLRTQPLALVPAAPAWRLVSAPRPAKGKLEIIGCSDAGRLPIRLLRRHRSAANRELERADRGDVVVVDRAPDEHRLELVDDTQVQRLEPAKQP